MIFPATNNPETLVQYVRDCAVDALLKFHGTFKRSLPPRSDTRLSFGFGGGLPKSFLDNVQVQDGYLRNNEGSDRGMENIMDRMAERYNVPPGHSEPEPFMGYVTDQIKR